MDNKIRFTPYEIKDCLFDRIRTNNLQKAIYETVKDGDIVLEAGGGTGILSMFALKAGAKHAYVIELSGRFTQVIREIAEKNGLSDRITVINGDATETDIPESVDVYISELLCTGLFNEPQIQAYNNCRRFFKPDTRCIPMSVTSDITFCNSDPYAYGLDISVDSYLLSDINKVQSLTSTDRYMEIVFDGEYVSPQIHKRGSVEPMSIGCVNSAVIESGAKLSPNVDAGPTKFLFNPELIFFKNRSTIGCEFGQSECVHGDFIVESQTNIIDYEIEYVAGGDTRDVRLRVF